MKVRDWNHRNQYGIYLKKNFFGVYKYKYIYTKKYKYIYMYICMYTIYIYVYKFFLILQPPINLSPGSATASRGIMEQDNGELCTGCENQPALTIVQYHGETRDTRESCLKLLRDHGVTPRSVVYPKCNVYCKVDGSRVWRCPRTITDEVTYERKRCGYKISNFTGTFLAKAKIKPWQVICYVNEWLQKDFSHEAVEKAARISR